MTPAARTQVCAIVMELVQGATLAERTARSPIPLDVSVPLVLELADALQYAQECGIVRRVLQPANIIHARRTSAARGAWSL